MNNPEAFERLIDGGMGWGNLDDAVEVAVINKRLKFLKTLIDVGGNVALASDLAVGPDRRDIRSYLESLR